MPRTPGDCDILSYCRHSIYQRVMVPKPRVCHHAFYIMLLQQWIRRYTQNVGGVDRRLKSRPVLFVPPHPEVQKFARNWAGTNTTSHLLVPVHLRSHIFLFTISNVMAIVFSDAVVFIGLLPPTLTILPITDDDCPYFTPMLDAW